MKRITTKYVGMDPRRCVACWECVDNCPKDVIGKVGFLWHKHAIFKNADSCIGCNKCIKTCPHGVFFKPDETAVAHRAKVKKSSVGQRLLPLTFVVSAVTGIGLHIAGHGTSHEVWHNWAVIHVVASVLWLVSAGFHIGRHRIGTRHSSQKGSAKKSRITFTLSVIFPIVAVTGILLLAFVDGANSDVGLWHYKLGILLIGLSLLHVFRRRVRK